MTDDEIKAIASIETNVEWLVGEARESKEEFKELREDINEHFRILNGSVRTNTIFRKIATYMGSVIFVALIGALVKIACFGV